MQIWSPWDHNYIYIHTYTHTHVCVCVCVCVCVSPHAVLSLVGLAYELCARHCLRLHNLLILQKQARSLVMHAQPTSPLLALTIVNGLNLLKIKFLFENTAAVTARCIGSSLLLGKAHLLDVLVREAVPYRG